MRLLLDENLSPTLVKTLSKIYPETAHVREFGLQSAPDLEVWAYAANHGYIIVTKDADFHHRSLLDGFPPKVIWVRLGNCSTHNNCGPLDKTMRTDPNVSSINRALVFGARLSYLTATRSHGTFRSQFCPPFRVRSFAFQCK